MDAEIQGSWNNVPAGAVFGDVGLMLAEPVEAFRRADDVYVLGEPVAADLVSRVFYATGDNGGELASFIEPLVSGAGVVTSIGDRVVVRDVRSSMARIERIVPAVVGASGQWVVEVRFVEISERWARSVGVDWEVVGSLDLGGLLLDSAASGTLVGELLLSAILQADEHDSGTRLLTFSRLHVVEGEDAELQVGETTPVPQRAVTESGAVVTTGFEYLDTGVLLRVGIRSEPDGRLRVTATPELSEVIRLVEGAPVRGRRRIQTSAVIEPGGVVVLGGFSRVRDSVTRDGLPGLLAVGAATDESEATRLFISLRVVDPELPIMEPLP